MFKFRRKKLAQSMNVSKEERHLSNINWYRSTVSIVNFEYFFLFIRQLQRDIQTPVKHLGWSVLRKRVNGYEPLTNFAKHSILVVWQGSACAFELHFCSYLVTWFEELKCFFFFRLPNLPLHHLAVTLWIFENFFWKCI